MQHTRHILFSRILQSLIAGITFALIGTTACAQSLSVEELADRLVSDNVPFVIDLRKPHEFEKAHIPNAVNIPFSALASRNLPPLGEVVVYADGMGRIDPNQAIAVLAEKGGLNPLYLEGGYAAWETRSGITTGGKGLTGASTGKILYQTLVDTQGEGIVIYDLRKGPRVRDQREALLEQFPRARIGAGSPYSLLRAPYANLEQKTEPGSVESNPYIRKGAKSADQLIVLIDDDNESAERVARRLQAGGMKRVAVLVGGDTILKHKGRSGLERQGGASIEFDPASLENESSVPEVEVP